MRQAVTLLRAALATMMLTACGGGGGGGGPEHEQDAGDVASDASDASAMCCVETMASVGSACTGAGTSLACDDAYGHMVVTCGGAIGSSSCIEHTASSPADDPTGPFCTGVVQACK
jgi:hypothetical protein